MNRDELLQRVERIHTFTIPARQKPERLDAFITHAIEHATRSKVQKAIDAGAVTVNNVVEKSNYKVKPGDVITVTTYRMPPLVLIPEELPITILYEDEDLLVIDKQPGILIHPGVGNRTGTLVNALLWHMGQREAVELEDDRSDDDDDLSYNEAEAMRSDDVRPGIVHRLDRDTTGVMVVGKKYHTTHGLACQFFERTVHREYVALVWGVVKDDSGVIRRNIGQSTRNRKLQAVVERGGKEAITEYTVLERYTCASLVRLKLRTGRTHQIRVHMSYLKHPVVGDADYGGREQAVAAVHHLYRREAQSALLVLKRQGLHARHLTFFHPSLKREMAFETPLPDDMQSAVDIFRSATVNL
jgi:23S rRNA pseudouridine1911/1915/1917 synthase